MDYDPEAAKRLAELHDYIAERHNGLHGTVMAGRDHRKTAAMIRAQVAEIERLKARYTPGHTDMMVSPESLDVWLEGNPLPAEIERLKATIEEAAEAASETAPDWETRCGRILSALGLDFGQNDEKPIRDGKLLRTAEEIRQEARNAALCQAAAIVQGHSERWSSGSGNFDLQPRIEGSRTGLAYAYAIIALIDTPAQPAEPVENTLRAAIRQIAAMDASERHNGNRNDLVACAAVRTARAALAAAPAPAPYAAPFTSTGVRDANGVLIHLGDRVVYKLEGDHTKPEYWNPEYEVVWEAPRFTLKHVGGGKDGGSHDFKLKYGGGNKSLYIVQPAPQSECPRCGSYGFGCYECTPAPQPDLCEDEGCPHYGTPHVCLNLPQPDTDEREAMATIAWNVLVDWFSETSKPAYAIADALLGAGWTRKREDE